MSVVFPTTGAGRRYVNTEPGAMSFNAASGKKADTTGSAATADSDQALFSAAARLLSSGTERIAEDFAALGDKLEKGETGDLEFNELFALSDSGIALAAAKDSRGTVLRLTITGEDGEERKLYLRLQEAGEDGATAAEDIDEAELAALEARNAWMGIMQECLTNISSELPGEAMYNAIQKRVAAMRESTKKTLALEESYQEAREKHKEAVAAVNPEADEQLRAEETAQGRGQAERAGTYRGNGRLNPVLAGGAGFKRTY